MAKAQDIRFDENDLFIDELGGDFQIIESDTQHVEDIIDSFAGWWKEFPSVGVGAVRFLGGSGSYQRLIREAKVQLKADGYNIKNISVEGSNIYVTGDRKNENL